jgi:aspartyl-tRNA(Asn)/glutamyl-tRNA(Gln) amidotransferase subunit C
MGLSGDDVARLARLARVAVAPQRLSEVAADLDAVLVELSSLEEVDTVAADEATGVGAAALPLREDSRDPVPLVVSPMAFAPQFVDGYFVVPRASGSSAGEP